MALSASLGIHAQERAAGGPLDTQSSWTALQNLINRNKSDVKILQTDVEAIKNCNKQRKLYVPGSGCVSAAVTNDNRVGSILACGNQGKVYSSSSNSCVGSATAASTYRWVQANEGTVGRPNYPRCPSPALGTTCSPKNSRCFEQFTYSTRCGTHGDTICNETGYKMLVCN